MQGNGFITTMVGRVKHWAKKDNGNPATFGFINPDDQRYGDVFIHFSEIEPWREGFKEPLEPGQIVKFDLYKDGNKLLAKNVEVKREPANISVDDFNSRENFGNRKGY